ncbi:MAG: hypothetical protein QMC83_09765 [Thermodesulfovibrionales bacterium]|nr:hypothetical protein [Thermodesulfovibrionales bacterium]
MLPKLVQDIFNRVKTRGENAALKVESPDFVYTTHEIIDLITLYNEGEKPALYLIRPDRLTEYLWDKADWGQPQKIPIEQSLETIEKSKNAFAVFIFWDIASRLDERDGQPSVRSFIPHFFLSPKATKKLLLFLEPLGTQYPNIVAPYITSLSSTIHQRRS